MMWVRQYKFPPTIFPNVEKNDFFIRQRLSGSPHSLRLSGI